MAEQLIKKTEEGYSNVMPKSWIEAIIDKSTGESLTHILQGFNMYFLSYTGNTEQTRCQVPKILRKKGLWITYVKYDGNVYTEWYNSNNIDDKSWGNSSNWRIGNNELVGDLTISANGNWVINGNETEFKAIGEKGNTPLIRIANNKLQVSYDTGNTYHNVSDNPVYTQIRTYNNKLQISTDLGANWTDASDEIAAYFRFNSGQGNNVGSIQISRNNKDWNDLSGNFVNNLHISKYIGADETLPTSGIAEGTIYAKGPTYTDSDTSHSNPIYRLWVYAYKGSTLAWQDNGEFTSIAAGIVQETGSNENAVMSQKATTEITQALAAIISRKVSFAGIATPTTNPGTPDGSVFYIANGKGTYTNFGGIDVTEDEVVILYYDTVWHKNATGIASNDKLTELESKTDELLDGKTVNLLEGAEWEVGRIFQNAEINTTEYPNYRVYKFNCESGDKITVAASYTPAPAFIGYIREDNKVEVVINGTGGAIEETTIDCVTAIYVVCEPVSEISNVTKLEKNVVAIINRLENKITDVNDELTSKNQEQDFRLSKLDEDVSSLKEVVIGSENIIDLLPILDWKVGRVFNSLIDTSSTDYKYAEISCQKDEKLHIKYSYAPSGIFIGIKNEDGTNTKVIDGTGIIEEKENTIVTSDGTYLICTTAKGDSYIEFFKKLSFSDSEIDKKLKKKIDDAPVNGKQYVRKDAGWEEVEVKSKKPVVTDLRNSVEWKNGRVVGSWIDTSATYSKLCEIEITKDGDELIVASNKSGPANVPFLSKKTDATNATNIISSTDGGEIPEQRIVCEKGVYIVCIYSHPTTDVTVLTKIEYPVDEHKEENKRNRGFLYGKTIASLGDSLATSGLWQNELVKKGAIFNAEKNYTAGQLNYSEGGTVTCDAKDANCGHIRAKRLVEDGIVIPDVIFIENVNDSRLAPPPNHETPSNIDDEPFFLTDVINYATTYNSKQDAITAWENNFASIVGTVAAKKGVAFLLKYKVSAKVFTINSAPTQNGYIEITVAGNDVKRITLTTSDTIATVIEKILAYDYSGWTDTKKSSDAVIFSPSITGDVDITANTCGLTFTKTTEESTNSIARCFCSVDVSKWNDKTVWKVNPGLFASYKGIVEYLQTAFPTAQIVFFIPETWGFNYNASIYKRADGTIDVDKIAKSYSYVGYLFTLQKQFCERYNLRVIDVRGKCGANFINIAQFNAPDEVHPKNLGYQRWGEQIVRELN